MSRFRYSDWAASWDDIAVGMRCEVTAEVVTNGVVTEVRPDAFVVEYVAHSDLVVLTCPRDGMQAWAMLAWLTETCDWWTGCRGLRPLDHPGVRATTQLVAEVAGRRAAIEGATGRAAAHVRHRIDPHRPLGRTG